MANDPFTENKAGFPQALAKDYACLSCLKANETDATYLCQDRQNRKVIIKITTAPFHAGLLENEINLLRAISQRKEPEAASRVSTSSFTRWAVMTALTSSLIRSLKRPARHFRWERILIRRNG